MLIILETKNTNSQSLAAPDFRFIDFPYNKEGSWIIYNFVRNTPITTQTNSQPAANTQPNCGSPGAPSQGQAFCG